MKDERMNVTDQPKSSCVTFAPHNIGYTHCILYSLTIMLCWRRAHTQYDLLHCVVQRVCSAQYTPSYILHCLLELYVRSSLPAPFVSTFTLLLHRLKCLFINLCFYCSQLDSVCLIQTLISPLDYILLVTTGL